jgi:hypothetical protein
MCWTRFVGRCFSSWNQTSNPAIISINHELAAYAPTEDDDIDTIIIKLFGTFYICNMSGSEVDQLYCSLFRRLARKNSRNSLDLKVAQWCDDSMRELLDNLAVTTTLNELRWQGDCLFDYHAPQLVKAISLNLSLRRVEMLRKDGSSGLTRQQQTLVAAYLARNSNLGSFLRQHLRQVDGDRKLFLRIWAAIRQIPRVPRWVLLTYLLVTLEVSHEPISLECTGQGNNIVY